ncbi:MAG TPA: holo-ACP synthase [Thermodesulfovibrionales bacterium]|nr:holo-ACP synthase [Thermodesulfovibrionales bacterium]
MSRIHQGIDIVDVEKFRAVLTHNPGLADELFTEGEREYCLSRRDPSLHFAGRFAAKESYLKAMGTGFRGTGIDHIFQEIEIRAANSGKPEIVLHGWAAKMAERRKIYHCSVSISHASRYVVASVLLTGE